MSDDPLLDRFLGADRREMPGQAPTDKRMDTARQAIEKLAPDRVAEAAANTEEIVRMLGSTWFELGFTPEQCVFALCLATINYRETVPEKHGGKEMFDRVASAARAYYDKNR